MDWASSKTAHLLDDAHRNRGMDGMVYAVQHAEMIDKIRRLYIVVIQVSN